MAIKRGLSFRNIRDAKVERFDFDGAWEQAFGRPQRTGIWYIFGGSGSGKTSFILQLMKRLAREGRILFESYEEGEMSASLQDGIDRLGLLEVNNRVTIAVDTEEELEARLAKRNSASIVFIDSLDLSFFRSGKHVNELSRRYPKKLFVFIGQASGARPSKKIGTDVLFIANQKIYVEGYRAFSRGRAMGELGYYTVWEQGAADYWDYK